MMKNPKYKGLLFKMEDLFNILCNHNMCLKYYDNVPHLITCPVCGESIYINTCKEILKLNIANNVRLARKSDFLNCSFEYFLLYKYPMRMKQLKEP